MRESTIDRFVVPVPQSRDVMTEILRAGAQKMLSQMIQLEVADWLAERASLLDEQGRRQVVRNGFLPKRKITTGVGQIEVQQPRVGKRDGRKTGHHWGRKTGQVGKRDITDLGDA
jgi:putative transposase